MVKFRTQYDQGDYQDFEVNNEPSKTEQGMAESMESVIGRMTMYALARPAVPNLSDAMVDDLMEDTILDEFAKEKTDMAQAIGDLSTQAVNGAPIAKVNSEVVGKSTTTPTQVVSEQQVQNISDQK